MTVKRTPYQRVAEQMHGHDDSIRDTIVYPSNSEVLGISEGEDFLILSHASSHDDGESTQVVWINTDDPAALFALQEAISRVIARVVIEKGNLVKGPE
jgi:hypothetical protein